MVNRESAPVGLKMFARNAATPKISTVRSCGDVVTLTRRPVYRLRRDGHHGQRCTQRDQTAHNRKPVGRHSMNQKAHRQITDYASNRRRQEVDRGLCRRILLHVLEVERHDRFERIEAAPCKEDGCANSGEDAVSPERVRDDSWSA